MLLDRGVHESLAGRASYHTLHSQSVSELGSHARLSEWLFRGGWPELYVRPKLDPGRYLADYVHTFVEKDIAAHCGHPCGTRWVGVEAKLAIQNVGPVTIPETLARELPDLHEIWIVTPEGDETRLSHGWRQVPIVQLTDGLAEFVNR